MTEGCLHGLNLRISFRRGLPASGVTLMSRRDTGNCLMELKQNLASVQLLLRSVNAG